MRCDWVRVLKICGQDVKWCNSNLEPRNEFAIEMHKTNNFGNIADGLRLRPVFEEFLLRHGGTIANQTNIDPHKFKAFGKDMTFEKAEQQAVG